MSYIFAFENFVKTYIFGGIIIFLDVAFCLFKFIFLGSEVAKNVYFCIKSAYNIEELNEKILIDGFQGHVVFNIEM